jgi:arginyl-tRNA synthetase
MSIIIQIKQAVVQTIHSIYGISIPIDQISINETKAEFAGDYTLVTFSLTKVLGKKPDELANEIGQHLIDSNALFVSYNVVKGFLNVVVSNTFYLDFLQQQFQNTTFGNSEANGKKVMVEYSSPNTNKPLHFGHLRNIFLGYSVAKILQATGHEVIKANLINDRGIHICKSMIAWKLFANHATPTSSGIKGDHLVGDYYVKFNDVYKEEIATLIQEGKTKEEAEKQAPIMLQAQEMLRKWEAGDTETLQIWKEMNSWVYAGFDITYKLLGIDFDKIYYESETYLLGKAIVEKGLADGVMYQKEDKSIWIDLSSNGLDQKLLLRGDGTSVYMTQDIGTAVLKYQDYTMDNSVYVIGDEQNYHMQVLQLILEKLGEPVAKGLFHLSYGMVELPTGKMKSREGNVVDADDMANEMIRIAAEKTTEHGKVTDFTQDELNALYSTLGLGALKFYLLRVDPKKKMIFNPEESIDFHGFTGPFVQYTHARICSILRKANKEVHQIEPSIALSLHEKTLLKQLEQYPSILLQSAKEFNPAVISIYLFNLAKEYNSFLVDHSILKAENEKIQTCRIALSTMVKNVLAHGLQLLGIQAPNKM